MNLSWLFAALQWLGAGVITSLLLAWFTKARRLKYVVTVAPARDSAQGHVTGERGFSIVSAIPSLEDDDIVRKYSVRPKYTHVTVKIISRNSATFAIEGAELGVYEPETGLIIWHAPDYLIENGERLEVTPQTIRRLLSDANRSVTYAFELFGRPHLLYVETVDDRHDRRGYALHRRWRKIRRMACKDSARAAFAVHLHKGLQQLGRVDPCFEQMYTTYRETSEAEEKE